MTEEEWRKLVSSVTDAMCLHTRSFVTPLSRSTEEEVRFFGTGSYITHNDKRYLVTCEHVENKGPRDHQFFGSEDVLRLQQPFISEPPPLDVAASIIADDVWSSVAHQAYCIPYERFAQSHNPIDKTELLFFRGYSDENARYGFGILETNGSGYCSQEKETGQSDPKMFDIFWVPDRTSFTDSTDKQAQKIVKFDDPHGFSGSLVWNTRFMEKQLAGEEWIPDDAVITGLLCQWDTDEKTLRALRIEHARKWLEKEVFK